MFPSKADAKVRADEDHTSGALMSRGDASAASTAARVTSTNVARSIGMPFSAPRACHSNR